MPAKPSIQKHTDFMKECDKLLSNESYRVTHLKKAKRAEEAAKPKPKTKK